MSDARGMNAYIQQVLADSEWLISLPGETSMSWWKRRTWIAGKQVRDLEACFVAVEGGNIVGMIECFTDHRSRVRHVTTMAMSVAATHRRKHIGRALMDSIIEWAVENPVIEKIELHVHEPNEAARALYKSVGFVEEGRRTRAIRHGTDRYYDDIQMALWVRS